MNTKLENSKLNSNFVNLLITINAISVIFSQMFSFCYFYNIT